MGRRGSSHVSGEKGDIRILVPDLFNLLQHSDAVSVRCIDVDHIDLRIYQCFDALKHVVRHAHRCAAQQPAVTVLGAVRILGSFFDILDGDQSAQVTVPVHDRQLLDTVGSQDLLGLLQRGSFRAGDQVFTGHHLADLPAVIRFKPQVPVRQDADQFALPGDRNTADLVPAHQLFRVADQVVRAQVEGVCNDAVLAAFDFVHLCGLLFNAHIFMDNAQAAFTGHCNRHLAVCDRIHGR